jgi:hypothetical protein
LKFRALPEASYDREYHQSSAQGLDEWVAGRAGTDASPVRSDGERVLRASGPLPLSRRRSIDVRAVVQRRAAPNTLPPTPSTSSAMPARRALLKLSPSSQAEDEAPITGTKSENGATVAAL